MARLILVFFALWLLQPAVAQAHAALVSSVPADGAVLPDPPRSAVLTFNEPVSPVVLALRMPDGTTVDLGPVDAPAAVLDLRLPEVDRDGAVVLTWRVVSADGHPVAGSLIFMIGAASDIDSPEPGDATSVPVLIHVVRVALFGALFFGVGGAFHARVVGRRPMPRWTAGLVLVGFLLIPLAAGLNGLDLLGRELSALATPEPYLATAGTSTAISLGLAAVAFTLVLTALGASERITRATISLAVLAAGATLAASGHAATAPPEILTRPALFLHGVALCIWLGALPMLFADLRRTDRDGDAALARFARLAPAAVGALLVGGLALVVVQLRSPSDLVATDWGRVLAVKLSLVALLLGVAALNRWRWTGPALAGDGTSRRSLRRAVGVEVVLAIAILAVVGLWRFAPPPRGLVPVAVETTELRRHLHGDGVMADVTLSPARRGPVRLVVDAYRESGEALVPIEVTIRLSHAQAGIEPVRRTLVRTADGAFASEGLVLPASGVWEFRLDLLVTDFEIVRLEDRFEVGD